MVTRVSRFVSRRLWLLVAASIVVLLAGTLVAQGVRGEMPEDAPDSNFVAQGPILDQQSVDASIADKNAQEQRYEQEKQAAANQSGGTKDGNYVPPAGVSDAPMQTRIIADGPLPSGWGQLYRIENRWGGLVNSIRTIGFAGTKSDDPIYSNWVSPGNLAQGVLIVQTTPSDPNAIVVTDEYLTPTRTGSIHVTSYSGTCLTLVSTNNTTYRFDVASRAWSCGANQEPPP